MPGTHVKEHPAAHCPPRPAYLDGWKLLLCLQRAAGSSHGLFWNFSRSQWKRQIWTCKDRAPRDRWRGCQQEERTDSRACQVSGQRQLQAAQDRSLVFRPTAHVRVTIGTQSRQTPAGPGPAPGQPPCIRTEKCWQVFSLAPLRTCAPSVKLDVGRKQGWGTERGVPRRDYGGVAGAVNSHTPHLKTAQHRTCSPTAAAWQAPHGRSFPKQLAGAAWRWEGEEGEKQRP